MILDELPYGPSPDFRIAVNANFQTSLIEAVELYNAARKEALALLYKHKELNKDCSTEVEAQFEEVAASCGHFSYSLQNFAEEMKVYLEVLDDLKQESEKSPRGRSWHWLRFWRSNRRLRSLNHSNDPGEYIEVAAVIDTYKAVEQDSLIDDNEDPDVLGGLISPVERKGATAFDADKPPNPSYTYRLWTALGVFRRDDIKFAIKVGAGAALYALPSFIAASRPIYQHWRGEWGLLSYMLVCSMTIGASNTTGFARFIGTCLGAICAIAAWVASQGNPYALATLGWLMSLWTSYVIVAQGKGPMGRFGSLNIHRSGFLACPRLIQVQQSF